MDSIAPGGMSLLSVGRFGDMKSAGGLFEPGDVLYGRMRDQTFALEAGRLAAGVPDELMPVISIKEDEFTPATYNDPALTRRLAADFLGRARGLVPRPGGAHRAPDLRGEDPVP